MRYFLLWLLLAATAAAQDEEWVGRRFMPRINAVPLAANGDFHWGKLSLPLLVKAVNDEWLEVGQFRFRKADVVPLERAEGYYTRLVELNPLSDKCYNGLAVVRTHLGMHDQAIEAYSSAIRLNPTKAMYYSNRGLLWHYSKGSHDAALKDYNESIQLDPTSASVHRARASIYRARNDLDAALKDYDEAIRLDPTHADTFNSRGLVWKSKGDLAAAIRDYEEAIRLGPNTSSAHSNLAWVLATASDPKYRDGKRALAAATAACELTSWKEVGPVRALAAASAETGEFNTAIQQQNNALKLISEKNKPAEQTRLKLYLAGKPYREKPAKGSK